MYEAEWNRIEPENRIRKSKKTVKVAEEIGKQEEKKVRKQRRLSAINIQRQKVVTQFKFPVNSFAHARTDLLASPQSTNTVTPPNASKIENAVAGTTCSATVLSASAY